MRILFITHKNTIYGVSSYQRRSSGLYNSTNFIVKGLKSLGVHAEIIEVQDNNCIDREVKAFKPDVVVIEAMWVVPEKYVILKKLHPKVKWFIHMHSGIPFLAQEGMACGWLIDSAKQGVGIIANSPDSYTAFGKIVPSHLLTYLPNVYLKEQRRAKRHPHKKTIDVGCFGAIRPLKNHLSQAFAAIQFARDLGRQLRFHVNATRTESGGAPIVKNLRELFDRLHDAELVEHHWHEPEDFVDLLHAHIDIGMQISLSETFNVVSADCITAGIPCVVSNEVPWASKLIMSDDDNIQSMTKILHRAWNYPSLVIYNQWLLSNYAQNSLRMWYDWLHHLR
jgi:hypothetical protein